MSKLKFLITLVIFIAIQCLILGNGSLANAETIKIGAILPLSGSAVEVGNDARVAIGVFFKHFNDTNLKHNYQVIFEDGQCGAGNAPTTAAQKLINIDQVKYILTFCSGEALQVGPISERAKVLMFSLFASHPDLRNTGDYSFRTYLDSNDGIKRFSEYIIRQGIEQIGIVTEDFPHAMGIKEAMKSYLGNRIVVDESFPSGTNDFRSLFAKIRSKNISILFLNPFKASTLATMIKQATEQRISSNLYSMMNPDHRLFRKLTGESSNGLIYISYPIESNQSTDYKKFMEEYLKLVPEGADFGFITVSVYNALKSITDGIEASADDPTLVKDFLYTYRGQGANGLIEYDKAGDLKNIHYILKRINPDGTISVVDQLNSTN